MCVRGMIVSRIGGSQGRTPERWPAASAPRFPISLHLRINFPPSPLLRFLRGCRLHGRKQEPFSCARHPNQFGIHLSPRCHENEHGARIPRVRKQFSPTCENCGRKTKGKGRCCRSCSMKLSPKAITSRALRAKNQLGRFISQNAPPF